MYHATRRTRARIGLAASLLAGLAFNATADVVTDWNVKAGEFIVESKLGTPPAVRVMALTQTAVYDAVNAITQRYPTAQGRVEGAASASIEAAVAAANRAALVKLIPAQQPAIDAAYQAALATIVDERAKAAGIAIGEKAAAAVLAMRADDGAAAPDTYRPNATAGIYVPTAATVAPQWPQRKPWLMSSAAQFRPGPPPALTSEVWARDYNEVKAFGGKNSTRRSAEQTEIARFWEASGPQIYHGIVRSVANQPGREVTQNARLFAAAAQAMDDALIAIFDAKYQYNFWRPITAIRNGDIDGNDATERDPAWAPFIDTPMHPEYPCAHCVQAGALSEVLRAEAGTTLSLTTTSPTAKGAARNWTKVDDLVQEVANARIYDGVHYRFSTQAGEKLGRQVGQLAAAKLLRVGQ